MKGTIQINLSEEQMRQLEKLANEEDITSEELAHIVLESYLDDPHPNFKIEVAIPAKDIQKLRAATGLGWIEAKKILALLPLDHRERIVKAAETQKRCLYDPLEDEEPIRKRLQTIKQEVFLELKNITPVSQYHKTHYTWSRIKTLMMERYGIIWMSPYEMNPWWPWRCIRSYQVEINKYLEEQNWDR